MQLISNEHREMQKDMHKEKDSFGSSSKRYIGHIMAMAEEMKTKDILDYGSGKGNLQQNLPFEIQEYDPAIKSKSLDPEPADIVVCGDVLEHVEPECLDNVIKHIMDKTKALCFFVVNGTEAKKHLPDGRNAHLIVQSGEWWFNKISQCFTINSYTRNFAEQDNGKILQEYIMLAHPKKGDIKNG